MALAAALMMLASSASRGQQKEAPQADAATLRQAGRAKNIIVGAAADPGHLGEAEYANTLANEFGQLEPENQMKFAVVHPRPGNDASSYDFSPADQLVAFANQHAMRVRGHCFVWHQQVAAWVTNGAADHSLNPAALSEILRNHIATVGGHYAGKVWAWDVVNEAFLDDGSLRSTVWYDSPGIGFAGKGTAYIEQAFRWARAADPAAKLFYNDYDAETINAKSDAIYAMAKDFRARGVPLDGIGFQAHINLKFDDPKTLSSFAANLKRFSDLGVEIHITELDVALDSNDEKSLATQGELYGKATAICLQTPTCRLLQTWGFTDKYSWIPSYSKGNQGWALPYDASYHAKPAHDSMLRALQAK
jgi:endo-1,4-beta-xylanase